MEEDRKDLVGSLGSGSAVQPAFRVGFGSTVDQSNHAITQPPGKTDIVNRINTIFTSGSGTHR
jgi:hypothetical protein